MTDTNAPPTPPESKWDPGFLTYLLMGLLTGAGIAAWRERSNPDIPFFIWFTIGWLALLTVCIIYLYERGRK